MHSTISVAHWSIILWLLYSIVRFKYVIAKIILIATKPWHRLFFYEHVCHCGLGGWVAISYSNCGTAVDQQLRLLWNHNIFFVKSMITIFAPGDPKWDSYFYSSSKVDEPLPIHCCTIMLCHCVLSITCMYGGGTYTPTIRQIADPAASVRVG